MTGLWTVLTAASGVVATVLIVLALGGGLLFSARATGTRPRPNWWLDLHNHLGGLALAFTLLHVFSAFHDRLNGLGLLQVFVPMTAGGWAWGITWGVLGTYALLVVVFTSWPKKRFSRRTWLVVHLLSIPATLLVAAHAWMIGIDRATVWLQALLALLAGLAVYPAVLRLFHVAVKRKERRARDGRRAPHTATTS